MGKDSGVPGLQGPVLRAHVEVQKMRVGGNEKLPVVNMSYDGVGRKEGVDRGREQSYRVGEMCHGVGWLWLDGSRIECTARHLYVVPRCFQE